MSAANTISYAQSTGLPNSRKRRATIAPQAKKQIANVTPNVLIEMPKTRTSGFTALEQILGSGASAFADSTINPDGKATLRVRQRRRAADKNAADDVPARTRLCGVRRRPFRRRRSRRFDRRDRGVHAGVAVLRLGQDRALDAWRQRGHPSGTTRAARDHRATVRASGPTQAARIRDGHSDAQRICDGPLAEEGDRVRDQSHPEDARYGRARRRDWPRAHTCDQPRRDGDDAGQLLRLAGRADRPVHALLWGRLRRWLRAQPGRGGGDHARAGRLRARLRDLLHAAAGTLA